MHKINVPLQVSTLYNLLRVLLVVQIHEFTCMHTLCTSPNVHDISNPTRFPSNTKFYKPILLLNHNPQTCYHLYPILVSYIYIQGYAYNTTYLPNFLPYKPQPVPFSFYHFNSLQLYTRIYT